MNSIAIGWFIACVILVIFELVLPGTFFPVIFAGGAFVTGLFALFIEDFFILGLVFALSSIVGIIFTKPFLEKHFNVNKDVRSSNIDAMIGKTGVITTAIHAPEKGRAQIHFEDWAAISLSGEALVEGEKIIVRKIEGATLVVEKLLEGV